MTNTSYENEQHVNMQWKRHCKSKQQTLVKQKFLFVNFKFELNLSKLKSNVSCFISNSYGCLVPQTYLWYICTAVIVRKRCHSEREPKKIHHLTFDVSLHTHYQNACIQNSQGKNPYSMME